MQARLIAWSSVVFLLAMAATATGQPSKSEKKRGQALYDKAKAAQKKDNCDAAIPQFTEALSLLENDFILFDLGQCFQAQGRNPSALHHYLLLNARLPDSPIAEGVQQAIATIEAQDERAAYEYYVAYLAGEAALPPERTSGEYRALAERHKQALEAKHPAWAKPAAPEPTEPAVDPATPPPVEEDARVPAATSTRHPGRFKKRLGLGLGVAGLATMAVGGYFGIIEAGDLKDQAAACAREPACDRLDALNAKGETYNQRGVILAAVGGGALIGGAVLYFMGRNDAARAARADVAIVPSLAPNGSAMVTLSGRF